MNKLLIFLIFSMSPCFVLAKPFSIERSEIITITSKDNKRECRLFIKTPRSQSDSSEGLGENCVLCMPGNAAQFSESLQKSLPQAIVEYLELKNEIHETIFPAAVSQGLCFLRK